MPSKALNRKKRGLYPAQNMRMAYDSVQSGQYTGRQAARMFNVPYATLNKRLSGKIAIDGQGAGRPIEMGAENERKLADYLFVSGRCGYGLSRREILELTSEFVRQENIKTRWKNGMPGFDWLNNFMKRHPGVVARKVQVSPGTKVNPSEVYEFYQSLEHLYEEEKLTWNDGHRFYSLMELSLSRDDLQNLNNQETEQSNDQLNASVLTCIRADGEKLPPLVAFHAQCVSYENRSDCEVPTNKKAAGGTLFCYWFKNIFIPLLPRDEIRGEKSIILFIKGQSLQFNMRILTLSKINGVILVKLPPKLSHYLQPQDIKCSSALVSDYAKQIQLWNKENIQIISDIQREEFVKFVVKTWNKSTNRNTIIKGFERTGLFPLDKYKFDENVFSEPLLKKFKEKKESGILKKLNDTSEDLQPVFIELPSTADAYPLGTPKIAQITPVVSQGRKLNQQLLENAVGSSKDTSSNPFQSLETKNSSSSNSESKSEEKVVSLKETKIPFTEESRLNEKKVATEKTFQDRTSVTNDKASKVRTEIRRSNRIFKRDSNGVSKLNQ